MELPSGISKSADKKNPETPIKTMEEMKIAYVKEVLALFNGNITRAAKALGMSRYTLHRWLRKLK